MSRCSPLSCIDPGSQLNLLSVSTASVRGFPPTRSPHVRNEPGPYSLSVIRVTGQFSLQGTVFQDRSNHQYDHTQRRGQERPPAAERERRANRLPGGYRTYLRIPAATSHLSDVPLGNAGINKPFDRILKSFADEAPELFLRLLGFVPAGVHADIQALRPETAPTMVLPDYVAVVRTGPGIPIIFHAEFQSIYHHDVPRDMARYGGSLAWQYQLPVKSALVLLRRERVPAEIPDVGHYRIGDTRTTHPFKTVRLWEIDPTPVLETNDPKLLPWALLLKSTESQVRKIASMVARQEDDEAVGRFLTLGSLRYNRNSLNEMLGGGKMGLVRAILDGSSLVQEERDQAAAGEARKCLRVLLRKRFPELESLAEIDVISNVDALESIIESFFDAGGADPVRAAILTAAKPN